MVAQLGEGRCHARIVDLAYAGFAAAGVVGDLHFADPRQAGHAPADQIAFADLGVVEVQIDRQLWPVNGGYQRQHIGSRPQGAVGVVDEVQVFKGENLPLWLDQIADAMQPINGSLHHARSESADLWDRDAHIAQPRARQVKAVHAQTLGHFGGCACQGQQHSGPCRIGQVAFKIAVHDGECGACLFRLGQVQSGSVSQANAKAHFLKARSAPIDRVVAPQHFGAGGELEAHVISRYIRHRRRL